MSKNLKSRIEKLMLRTDSPAVLENCKAAIEKFNEYSSLSLPASVMEKMESVIAEDFISNLSDESAIFEFSDIAINNLGIKNSIATLSKLSVENNMPLRYVLEKLKSMESQPEWMIFENFINLLTPFNFDPTINEAIHLVKRNANKYSEDIKIHRAIFEASKSRSSYLISGIQNEIDEYLAKRNASSRNVLLEKLNKYNFDPYIRGIHNVILESANSFEIKATSNDGIVKKVFSPVLVSGGKEIFVVNGKVFEKNNNDISPLNENKIKSLPEGYIELANFINSPNVEVGTNLIKIYDRNKKIVISENESGELDITMNEKTVNKDEFTKIYISSGMYNSSEFDMIKRVNSIVENWNNIFEIDYVKTIFSKAYPNRRADVFRCGGKTFINTDDILLRENLFYPNCTAHQSRNHILEFLNYDLSLTFDDMMTNERKELNILEDNKNEYLQAISLLESKIKILEKEQSSLGYLPDAIKSAIDILNEEISSLKNEYFNNQKKINRITKITEGVGAGVGDTADFLKKKLP